MSLTRVDFPLPICPTKATFSPFLIVKFTFSNTNLSLYFANYKYSSDKDGAPDFVAKNLIGGFVRNLEDYKKYLMVCFRCYQICTSKYKYKSLWIVNTTEPLNNVIGSFYEDFDFVKVDEIEIDNFLETIKRSNESNDSNLLIEKYLH